MSRKIVAILGTLLIGMLACNLPSRNRPDTTIPVTTEAAESLRKDLEDAARQLRQGDEVELVITEAELTSLVALELQQLDSPPFQEPQISLQEGQILVTGKVHQANLLVPVEVLVAMSVTPAGELESKVESAKMGFLDLPQQFVDAISEQIDLVFTDQISTQMEGVTIRSLTISDGVMVIHGAAQSP